MQRSQRLRLAAGDLFRRRLPRSQPGRRPGEAGIELHPDGPGHFETLGAAYSRAGDFKAAVSAFKKSMALRNGGDSSVWFFLAMAEWQLGNRDAARVWYEKAVGWMEQNNPNDAELRRFRAEARELLELNEKK